MSTAMLRKSGGSLILTIPQSYTVQNNLKNGCAVDVEIHGEALIVRPQRVRKSLADLLAETPKSNRAKGWDELADVGNEA